MKKPLYESITYLQVKIKHTYILPSNQCAPPNTRLKVVDSNLPVGNPKNNNI